MWDKSAMVKTDRSIGTDLTGYYLKAVQSLKISFPIAAIASLINAAISTDKYVIGMAGMVKEDRSFEPMAKSASIQSGRLDDKTGAKGQDNMGVSGLLCVYRLLCWMTKGKAWVADDARRLWSQWDLENPDARDEDRLDFFDTNLDSNARFTRKVEGDRVDVYLGYSMEDWSRGLCMLATIYTSWKTMWDQLGVKRDRDLFEIPFETKESVDLDMAEDITLASEKDEERLKALEAIAYVQDATKHNDVQESLFRSALSKFIEAPPGTRDEVAEEVDFAAGMEDINQQIEKLNSYSNMTHKASVVAAMNNPDTYNTVRHRQWFGK